MDETTFDKEYAELMLQKASKVEFTKITSANSIDYGALIFNYNDQDIACASWSYMLFRLLEKSVLISLRINDKGILEVDLYVKELNIKISTFHNNYNAFDLSVMMDRVEFNPENSVVHICCNYYDLKEDKMAPLFININNEKESCITKGQIDTLYNFGFEFHEPEPLEPFS